MTAYLETQLHSILTSVTENGQFHVTASLPRRRIPNEQETGWAPVSLDVVEKSKPYVPARDQNSNSSVLRPVV